MTHLLAPPLAAQEMGEIVTVPVPGTDASLVMVFVPDGAFLMGSPPGEVGRDEDEGPVHSVTVSGFWMTVHEVTHDQFGPFRFRRLDDSRSSGAFAFDADAVTRPSPPYEDPAHGMEQGAHPVTGMTRWSALHYARWLSRKTGRLFRLPTEAEWEYACRGGVGGGEGVAEGVYGFGPGDALDDFATYSANSGGTYGLVGAKAGNRFGIHDMIGNVAEWVLDEYEADFYGSPAGAEPDPMAGRVGRGRGIVRGGAFDDDPSRIRCAERFPEAAAWKRRDPQIPKSRWWNTDSEHVGFRLVSSLGEPSAEQIRAYWSRILPEA